MSRPGGQPFRSRASRTDPSLDSSQRRSGSHDFNNLLTAMMSFSEIVHDTLERADPRDQLPQVLQAGERAASLIRQLLAFSRQQPLRPVALDLNEVVADVEKLLSAVLGANITVQSVR